MPIIAVGSGGTTAAPTSVRAVIDRVYRSYLHPGDDQPARALLATTVDNIGTAWTYSAGMLAADEEELFAPGVVVEVGTEQALVTAVDLGTRKLTVVRGYNGTARVGHDADEPLTVQPPFSRQSVFDAVADGVVGLYPTLYHVDTTALTTASTYVEVPAEVVNVTGFSYETGSRWVDGNVALLDPFPPSSTGKAVNFYGIPPGKSGHLTYRALFARPTAESDDLAASGVQESWLRIVEVGAAAQILSGRELDSVQQQYITEQLRAESYPALTAMRQAGALWEVRDRLMREAAKRLYGSTEVPVAMNSVNMNKVV